MTPDQARTGGGQGANAERRTTADLGRSARGFPRVVSIDLPYEGSSARDARRWARCVRAGRVDDETIEAVVVCFSELVTNSQVHTRPSPDRKEITCRLRITTAIRGEVIDAGSP